MLEKQELERAIAALEVHRTLLGDVAVDTAVSTLQEKLIVLEGQPALEEYQHITVLVADLSGFTAMSELMDAEEVRDTVNALWERLDNVITAWNGRIDKHTGDGLIALFGLPAPCEDDTERAVQAALDMQLELSLFNRALSNRPYPVLGMRIGIHCGPVFLGKVGNSDFYTAVGETIDLTHRIEEVSPTGSVIITQEVYNHVQTLFEATVWETANVSALLYEIKREKQRPTWPPEREPFAARLVGRTAEFEQLQQALDGVMQNGTAHVVTIVGSAGLGKTRLWEEFERWLDLQPTAVSLFKGRAYQNTGQWPNTLLRDVLANYFHIHVQNSEAVGRAKLEQGILTVLKENSEAAWQHTHVIGQVAGFDFLDSQYLKGQDHDAQGLQKLAFRGTVQFLRAATVDAPAVLLLEDVHWADEGSLAWVDFLIQACQWMPLLLVCTARPEVYEKRPSWKSLDSIALTGYTSIELKPLSSIDSRHLIAEWLQKIPQPPLKLTDLTVDGGRGSPYGLEEWLYYWLDTQVILQLGGRWQVQPGRLNEVRIPVSLPALLRARLELLPHPERRILQQASVMGRLFWESAVIRLSQTVDPPIPADDVQKTLQTLKQKNILELRHASLFPGQLEYLFKHDTWHDVAYATLPGVQQRAYHAQAVIWLQQQMGNEAGRYAALLAGQYEGAGEMKEAAEWYGRAADEALGRNEVETAVRHYRHAIRLLSGDAAPSLQVVLNEKLARLHRLEANFPAAATIFTAMQTAAHTLQDGAAFSRASQGLFWVQVFQENWKTAGQTAQQAETAARTTSTLTEELALALAMKGWVLCHQDTAENALEVGREAWSISTAVSTPRGMAFSNLLLGKIYIRQGKWAAAQQVLQTAVTLFQQIDEPIWVGLALGYVADVAQAQEDWETAESLDQQALQIGREVGDVFGTMLTLRRLGELAAKQGQLEQAETYLQQALALAERNNLVGYHTELLRVVDELT